MIDGVQLNFFDEKTNQPQIQSCCEDKTKASMEDIFLYFNDLNEDTSHKISNDDICTPMECVQKMVDYVPDELWKRKNIRVLDPCCGNGNFGAYCQYKTAIENIWFNELNPLRYANCRKILNPIHINNEDAFKMTGEFSGKWDLIVANPPYSDTATSAVTLLPFAITVTESLPAPHTPTVTPGAITVSWSTIDV